MNKWPKAENTYPDKLPPKTGKWCERCRNYQFINGSGRWCDEDYLIPCPDCNKDK